MSTPGQISTIAEILRQAYQLWADQNNMGKVLVVGSLDEQWNQSNNNSQSANIVICYVGDEARGPFELAAATHRGDVSFDIGIIRAKTPTATRELNLTQTVGNARPLYDLMEEARDVFRALTNISVEMYADYKSTRDWPEAVEQYKKLVNAFVINGSVAMDYPQLSNVPDNTLIPV